MRYIIIVLLGLSLLWFWTRPSSSPEEVPFEEKEIPTALTSEQRDNFSVSQPPPVIEKKQKVPTPWPSSAEPSLQSEPDEGRAQNDLSPWQKERTENLSRADSKVEIEIKEGWAVVQEDILMGPIRDDQLPEDLPPQARLQMEADRPIGQWDPGPIPYTYSRDFKEIQKVEDALAEFTAQTGLGFVRAQRETANFLVFSPSQELCASYLGKVGGPQPILLSPECGSQEIFHELMHALGFVHEQSREDRDRFIEVLWENIKEDKWAQFELVPDAWQDFYTGRVFDFNYQSIMLYSTGLFAVSADRPTMRTLTGERISPVKSGLSPIDIERIGYVYDLQ